MRRDLISCSMSKGGKGNAKKFLTFSAGEKRGGGGKRAPYRIKTMGGKLEYI